MRILREGREQTHFDTYPERLTFGFAVSVPRSVALEVDPPNPREANAQSFSIREDLTVGDLGLGYQLNREVSIGIALGGLLRTSHRHSQFLLVKSGAADFVTFTDDRSSLAIDARVKAGVDPGLRLGEGEVDVQHRRRERLLRGAAARQRIERGRAAGARRVRLRLRHDRGADRGSSAAGAGARQVMHPTAQPSLNLGASVPFGKTKRTSASAACTCSAAR